MLFTRRHLHECLDHRLCSGRHDHQPIAGQIKVNGTSIGVSKFAERYTPRFATSIVRFLKKRSSHRELPMLLDELSVPWKSQNPQEQLALAGVKRRRLDYKQRVSEGASVGVSHLERSEQRKVGVEVWQGIFRELGARTPRVGTVCVDLTDPLAARIQWCFPDIHLKRIEVCRGTERFRVPPAGVTTADLPLRQTVVMHRETGEIEMMGEPEAWQELKKSQQVRKASPARLSLTVFGQAPGRSWTTVGSSQGEKRSLEEQDPSSEPAAKRQETSAPDWDFDFEELHKDASPTDDPGHDGVPASVARHGPAFRQLSNAEQTWLKKVHHRMGHPDPDRLARFLRSTHADGRIVAGALDMQCDACAESQKGFKSSRPAAIHEDVGFNHTLGIDTVEWKNSQAPPSHFCTALMRGHCST